MKGRVRLVVEVEVDYDEDVDFREVERNLDVDVTLDPCSKRFELGDVYIEETLLMPEDEEDE